MNQQHQSDGGWSAGKVIAVILGGIAVLLVLSCLGCFGWLMSSPEGGVKLSHDMDPYAVEYLEEHQLLRADEQLVGYYDRTLSMDGTNAYIVTDQRFIHHHSQGNFTAPLTDVETVEAVEGDVGGTIFIFSTVQGDVFRAEIDPLNGSETFARVLRSAFEKANHDVHVPNPPGSTPTSQQY